MALKRSGVRASSAPLIIFSSPLFRGANPSVRLPLGFSLLLLCMFAVFLLAPVGFLRPVHAQVIAGVSKIPTDVILFVRPLSSDSARIGLAYRKLVPHAQVQREISKLLTITGWKLAANAQIEDSAVHSDDPKRFPPTTGALFTLENAPQLHDNAPVLRPYLQAFHAWNRVEILLDIPDIQPYNGLLELNDKSLDIKMVKSDGIYSYLATIREHQGELPSLVQKPSTVGAQDSHAIAFGHPFAQSSTDSPAGVRAEGGSLFWPYLFIATGTLLTGGVAVYLLTKRHATAVKTRGLR